MTPPGGIALKPPSQRLLTAYGYIWSPDYPTTRKGITMTDQERLTALRSRLEGVLNDPDTSPRDVAALSREYRQLVAQLAGIALPASGSALDEISARRVQRGAS